MRVILTAFLTLALGALAMSDDKDDKKESKYTEKVTIRVWDEKMKVFRKQSSELDAYRAMVEKQDVIVIGGKFAVGAGGTPTVGTEIIDKAGVKYNVTKVSKTRAPFICYVVVKP